MKKKFLIILLAGGIASCTSDLSGLNNDLKSPEEVPPGTLFANATRELMDVNAGANQFINVFRVITQYWQQTTYNEESQYKFETRSISGAWWRDHYYYTLQNLKACRAMVGLATTDETAKKNQLAIIDILEVVTFYYLVTTFGNVPYSESLNDEIAYPKYDDANTIYTDLLRRITADIAALDATGAGFGASDLLYGGNVAAWKKFAASFKLKMAMLIADSDANAARTAAQDAIASGVFASAADECRLVFLSSSPYMNPVYEELVETGRADYVPNRTIVDSLKAFNDPRISRYFQPMADGSYAGAPPGPQADFDSYSGMGEMLQEPTLPGYLLEYGEVRLLMAEAAQRGWATGGTAAEHYRAGITASMKTWGVTDAEITDYLAQAKVAYDAANWKKSIGIQKWFAYFNRGHDGWTDVRRLDFPLLPLPQGAVSGFPNRYKFPISEHNVNRKNYESAAQAVGGDRVETKLWWDKN
ncbi:SusD/RagB family nutrient-binding outer membrane lipoprotein [Chitinophaga pollutisoli]|uniref:SusD/RagB family nutrient-binding outer membrane lipoprotein n=1 Tax=Chitinophaga pollutisoli TaxID=3133966 RepID=A0ABZ2YPW0_9BACT